MHDVECDRREGGRGEKQGYWKCIGGGGDEIFF